MVLIRETECNAEKCQENLEKRHRSKLEVDDRICLPSEAYLLKQYQEVNPGVPRYLEELPMRSALAQIILGQVMEIADDFAKKHFAATIGPLKDTVTQLVLGHTNLDAALLNYKKELQGEGKIPDETVE